MFWLLAMLVVGIVVGRLSHRYANGDPTRESRGGGLFLIALTCLPVLTACGGDSGDSGGGSEMVSPPDPAASGQSGDLCNLAILFLADPNAVCSNRSGSSSQPVSPLPPASPIPPAPPSSTGTISIRGNVESEPNNDPINANLPTFASSTGRAGFWVDGTIDAANDVHDVFVITRSRAADFNIEICPPGEMICEQTMPIDTGTAFYEVLDQGGQIIKSSAGDGTNFGRMRIEAGMVYYLRVVAGDTMGTPVGYTLTAYETN